MNPTASKWFAITLRAVLALFATLAFIFAFFIYHSFNINQFNSTTLLFIALLIWSLTGIISVFHLSLKESWAVNIVPIYLALTFTTLIYVSSQINSPAKILVILILAVIAGIISFGLYGTQSANYFWASNSEHNLPSENIFSPHPIEVTLEKSIRYAIIAFTVILSFVLCFNFII